LQPVNENYYEWCIKGSQEPNKKRSKYAADYKGHEDGECCKIKKSAGCHYPDEALRQKAAGNVE
jgi:hypothetical protein